MCHATAWRSWATVGEYTLLACDSCDLITTRPLPDEAAIVAFYQQADYFDVAAERPDRGTADARRRLDAIERVQGPGSLLEIGPGHGWFCAEAVRRGWTVTVIEPSPTLAAAIRTRGDIDVQEHRLEDAGIADRFDAVVAWEVVEHTADPGAFLRAMDEHLRPHGVLALSTPNLGGWLARLLRGRHPMVIPPEHLNYLRFKTVKRWARDNRFAVVSRASSSHLRAEEIRRGVRRFILGRQPTQQVPHTASAAAYAVLALPAAWADRMGWGTHLECVLRKERGA